MRKFIFAVIPLSLLLCGCPKRAEYARPTLPVPETWTNPPEMALPQSEAAAEQTPVGPAMLATDMKWEEFFTDARLRGVIKLALENNRDLRIAALNIEKAQALYQVQAVARKPVLGASASGNVYQLPDTVSHAGEATTSQQYQINLGVTSWELDFFDRVKSLKSAALEQYLATEQARDAARISLIAAVATAYMGMAADLENLRLAQATLDTQTASYELIRQSRDVGMKSDLDVSQARSQVEVARADIAQYSGRIAQDKNALTLLLGAPLPDELLPQTLDALPTLPEISAGLPSDVLLRRPDILMAEHQLKAKQANIGAARAAYFPRIALTGGIGLMSGALDDLFRWGSRTWNFAPQASVPLFDSGTRDANYAAAEVDRNIAVATYEKAIQTAFREVNDALSLRVTLTEQQNAQRALVDSLQETYRLSETRYDVGYDSYLNVLVAQRSLYAAEQQLIGVRLTRLTNLVTLYKVLGGGV